MLISWCTADARPWKPTPKDIAQDYAEIQHNKVGDALLILWWWVPQFADDQTMEPLLDKYVVLSIVQSHTPPSGIMTFDSIDSLQPVDANGTPLVALTGDKIPPVITGWLASLHATLRQSLGPMGQGIHSFVFDGGNVHACAKGKLSVTYQDETYVYDTPIPGCTK